MDDRIKLSEAMGWTHIRLESFGIFGESPRCGMIFELPDPFTDANEDYAVLEFARNSWLTKDPPHPDKPEWNRFCDALWEIPTLFGSLLFYKVGDYARAALKVIENKESTDD